MKCLTRFLWIIFALLVSAGSAFAQSVITLNPSADTFLMKSLDDLTADDTAQGASGATRINSLYIVNANDGDYQSYSLLRFDLSAYAGFTVTGAPTLTIYYESLKDGSYGATRVIEVRLLDIAFDTETATFNNYGATNWDTTLISTFNDTVGTVGDGNGSSGSVTFSLTSGALQNWIDSPASNFGIALVGTLSSTPDIYGYSVDNGTFKPELTFTVAAVPESATYALLAGLTALGLALWRRRNPRRAVRA